MLPKLVAALGKLVRPLTREPSPPTQAMTLPRPGVGLAPKLRLLTQPIWSALTRAHAEGIRAYHERVRALRAKKLKGALIDLKR